MSLQPFLDELLDQIEVIQISEQITEVYGDYDGSYFPFLALPQELIAHTFSFLPIADRMRARVNKRLDDIELKSKHYVKCIFILEEIHGRILAASRPSPIQFISFHPRKLYSPNCIERIAQNTSVGQITLELIGSEDFHREVFNLMKNFDVKILHIKMNSPMAREMMTASFFLDLAEVCWSLRLGFFSNISPDDWHEMYKVMSTGAVKLRKLESRIARDACISFLALIGIGYRDGRFYPNGNIEEYKFVEYYVEYSDNYIRERTVTHIFDGHMQIALHQEIFDDDRPSGIFKLRYHETSESLEQAKDGLVKIEVDAE